MKENKLLLSWMLAGACPVMTLTLILFPTLAPIIKWLIIGLQAIIVCTNIGILVSMIIETVEE